MSTSGACRGAELQQDQLRDDVVAVPESGSQSTGTVRITGAAANVHDSLRVARGERLGTTDGAATSAVEADTAAELEFAAGYFLSGDRVRQEETADGGSGAPFRTHAPHAGPVVGEIDRRRTASPLGSVLTCTEQSAGTGVDSFPERPSTGPGAESFPIDSKVLAPLEKSGKRPQETPEQRIISLSRRVALLEKENDELKREKGELQTVIANYHAETEAKRREENTKRFKEYTERHERLLAEKLKQHDEKWEARLEKELAKARKEDQDTIRQREIAEEEAIKREAACVEEIKNLKEKAEETEQQLKERIEELQTENSSLKLELKDLKTRIDDQAATFHSDVTAIVHKEMDLRAAQPQAHHAAAAEGETVYDYACKVETQVVGRFVNAWPDLVGHFGRYPFFHEVEKKLRCDADPAAGRAPLFRKSSSVSSADHGHAAAVEEMRKIHKVCPDLTIHIELLKTNGKSVRLPSPDAKEAWAERLDQLEQTHHKHIVKTIVHLRAFEKLSLYDY